MSYQFLYTITINQTRKTLPQQQRTSMEQ